MKNKNFLKRMLLWAAVLLCLALAACLSMPVLAPGVYRGRGEGYRGPVLVEVLVSEAGIEDIEILSHEDVEYNDALEELRDTVLEYGSTDVDTISGATISSRGFLDAVDAALSSGALSR